KISSSLLSASICLSVSNPDVEKYLFSEKGTFTALSNTKRGRFTVFSCSGQKDIVPNSKCVCVDVYEGHRKLSDMNLENFFNLGFNISNDFSVLTYKLLMYPFPLIIPL